jgi:hypothetical protein
MRYTVLCVWFEHIQVASGLAVKLFCAADHARGSSCSMASCVSHFAAAYLAAGGGSRSTLASFPLSTGSHVVQPPAASCAMVVARGCGEMVVLQTHASSVRKPVH